MAFSRVLLIVSLAASVLIILVYALIQHLGTNGAPTTFSH
jgi:hypothetical protein